MKSSKLLFAVVSTATLFQAAAALAARVDMNDPRRALGREDNVRIDAQLVQDTVSSGSPVGVTYQIQNLSTTSIAVADKVCDVTYDADSRTIDLAVGAEVPKDGRMPRLVVIAPGETKTFTAGAILHINTPTVSHAAFASTPRYVQIKVSILRDVAPFQPLIVAQERTAATAPLAELTDKQFDQWLESNDTIFLNSIPVQFTGGKADGLADASQRGRTGSF